MSCEYEILSEYGYHEALYGLGLSHGKTSGITFAEFKDNKDGVLYLMHKVAKSLAGRGDGHDKFLRMLQVTMRIKLPLRMWKQVDTYKIATVTQSESTMHTLLKTPIDSSLFSSEVDDEFLQFLAHLEELRVKKNFEKLNDRLPQSFYQTRILQLNYAVVRNIKSQRRGHKQGEWDGIIEVLDRDIQFPEFIQQRKDKGANDGAI